jgi:hypothetical protein
VAAYLCASLAVVAFVASVARLRVLHVGARSVEVLHEARDVIGDGRLTEIEKERAIRRGSLALFRSSLSITWRLGLALAMALLPVAAFQAFGLTTISTVLEVMLGWRFIAGSSLALVAFALVVRSESR